MLALRYALRFVIFNHMILLQIAEIEQKSIILTTTICCGIRNLIILDWNRFLSVDVCGFCILAVSLTYLNQSEFKNRIIILGIHCIGSLMVKSILIKFTNMSDLSQVFNADDISTIWLAISEIIRVQMPNVRSDLSWSC